MFKAVLAAVTLAAMSFHPMDAGIHDVQAQTQTKSLETPNLATLPVVAANFTAMVSSVENQPMHLLAVVAGLNTSGACSEAIYQNKDGTLTVGLLLGAKMAAGKS